MLDHLVQRIERGAEPDKDRRVRRQELLQRLDQPSLHVDERAVALVMAMPGTPGEAKAAPKPFCSSPRSCSARRSRRMVWCVTSNCVGEDGHRYSALRAHRLEDLRTAAPVTRGPLRLGGRSRGEAACHCRRSFELHAEIGAIVGQGDRRRPLGADIAIDFVRVGRLDGPERRFPHRRHRSRCPARNSRRRRARCVATSASA